MKITLEVEIVENPTELYCGLLTYHPDGYLIYFVSGDLWVDGRFSNYFSWKKVNEDGTLSDEIYNGYGWL